MIPTFFDTKFLQNIIISILLVAMFRLPECSRDKTSNPDIFDNSAVANEESYHPERGNPAARRLKNPDGALKRPLRVGVRTWGGFAGGQFFNAGFDVNSNSEYQKVFGMNVEFIVNDDLANLYEAWKQDRVDFVWATLDSFPMTVAKSRDQRPKIVFLASSRDAPNLIPDIFFAKEQFLRQYPYETQALIAGWLIGAARINHSDEAKKRAIEILGRGLNQKRDFCANALESVRLANYGDNIKFFNLFQKGVSPAQKLYEKMYAEYNSLGLVQETAPYADLVDTSFLESVNLYGPRQLPE